jgi:hypothetical protein
MNVAVVAIVCIIIMVIIIIAYKITNTSMDSQMMNKIFPEMRPYICDGNMGSELYTANTWDEIDKMNMQCADDANCKIACINHGLGRAKYYKNEDGATTAVTSDNNHAIRYKANAYAKGVPIIR